MPHEIQQIKSVVTEEVNRTGHRSVCAR